MPILLLLIALTAAQDAGREPVKVGGAIKEPKKLKNVPPEYPDDALKAGLQGVVVLQCTIDIEGRVANVEVLKGPLPLQEPATKAVKEWRYSPTLLDGQAVPVIMTVTLNFNHGGHVILSELIDSLGHSDEYIREAAAQTLGRLGHQAVKAVPALQKAAQDESERVRKAAAEALESVQGSSVDARGGIPLQAAEAAKAQEAPKPQTVEGASVPPQLTKRVRPKYPRAAFDKKIEGAVVVELLIDAEGRVAQARVVQSVPGLDEAAVECVRKWRFKPALKNGQPVATVAQAPIVFKIY